MIWHTDFKKHSMKSESSLLPKGTEKEKPETEGQPVKLTDLLRLYWQQYCEKSSIHGVRYIYDPTLRSIERLIWTALVITCITLTCIAYFILAERYSSQKLQTVVENSQFPVFQIAFPAVGVCTNNRINWQKFEEAKATFLPPNAEQSVVDTFTNFVRRMESMRFGHFESFAEMDDVNLEALDAIDVTNLARFMSFRCEDIFVNGSCRWRRVPFNCCSAFITERTEFGYCLVYNSVLSQDSLAIRKHEGKRYYPYHNSKAGQGTGLNFILQLNDSMKRPNTTVGDSVTILVKGPAELSSNGYTITPGTETYVIVRPEITESDPDLRRISESKRNCFFEDEQVWIKYNDSSSTNLALSNCFNICHEEHLRKYCNCTLQLFFLSTDKSVEKCRASHFRCLAKHNGMLFSEFFLREYSDNTMEIDTNLTLFTDIFSYDKSREEDAYFSAAKPGMTCDCLVPCNTVEYYTALSTLPLKDVDLCNITDIHTFEIDVHYQSEVIIRYRTSLEFTSIDLIANFGGIFGLCLGASMVSAVELLYYLTFGLGLYLYDNNYHTVFMKKLRDFRIHLRNSLSEEYIEATHLKRKASFVPKRPPRKENNW